MQGPQSNDLFLDNEGTYVLLEAKRVISKNVHGTGCTLSAAIAANIANSMSKLNACKAAKDYLLDAINASKENSVGKGDGMCTTFATFGQTSIRNYQTKLGTVANVLLIQSSSIHLIRN